MANNTEKINYEENVGIAFVIVTVAAISTSVGALIVLCLPTCILKRNHLFMASALGFSSGVMLYVSFVEIILKSYAAFETCDCLWSSQEAADAAFTASTLCFFGGIALVYIFDTLVHLISHRSHSVSHNDPFVASDLLRTLRHQRDEQTTVAASDPSTIAATKHKSNSQDMCSEPADKDGLKKPQTAMENNIDSGDYLALKDGMSFKEEATPAEDVLGIILSQEHISSQSMGQSKEACLDLESQLVTNTPRSIGAGDVADAVAVPVADISMNSDNTQIQRRSSSATSVGGQSSASSPDVNSVQMKERLYHTGVMTALSIALHNFPEGLLTFISTLSDPQVGAAIATAIAIHNIPEGLCVSVLIYYSTGNPYRAFFAAFFSGMMEILGAALGYAFLIAIMGPAAYATMFGLVSGVMVTLVIKELMPTAQRFDPQDKVVTASIIFGMAIMALSLVLFRL